MKEKENISDKPGRASLSNLSFTSGPDLFSLIRKAKDMDKDKFHSIMEGLEPLKKLDFRRWFFDFTTSFEAILSKSETFMTDKYFGDGSYILIQ